MSSQEDGIRVIMFYLSVQREEPPLFPGMDKSFLETQVMVVKNRKIIDLANAIVNTWGPGEDEPRTVPWKMWAFDCCTFLNANVNDLTVTPRSWSRVVDGNHVIFNLTPSWELNPPIFLSDFGFPLPDPDDEGPLTYVTTRPRSFTARTGIFLDEPEAFEQMQFLQFQDRHIPLYVPEADEGPFQRRFPCLFHRDCVLRFTPLSQTSRKVFLELLVYG
ncbi:hypothetical protein SISNIDRAFT_484414 [Sistotremastrum niveocremeum HHB9708]|uniref:Uncharacterized protein n=1 Tax=Sistotremastrum niveocremeum HHB9708 TaxID=1314777 RepID=A0A164WAS8_9AGAM|nr:hypothetical protein SISNIDRAFT_484414 [Sistotremastrum niveocremeum HHB9708]